MRERVPSLVRRLWPVAEELGCQEYLQRVLGMAEGETGAQRQLALLEETGSPQELARALTARSRLSPA